MSKTPIIRHVKITGTYSPFDAELDDYWESRNQKMGKKRWAKGSKYLRVAKQQNWKCPICGEALYKVEDLETHHIKPVKDGGSDDTENFYHLHKPCHKQEHSNPSLWA